MIVYLTAKFYFLYLVAYSQWNKSVFRRVCGYHVVACNTMTILKCFDICDTRCVAGSWGYSWHWCSRYSVGIFCTTERHRKMQTTNGSIWGAVRGGLHSVQELFSSPPTREQVRAQGRDGRRGHDKAQAQFQVTSPLGWPPFLFPTSINNPEQTPPHLRAVYQSWQSSLVTQPIFQLRQVSWGPGSELRCLFSRGEGETAACFIIKERKDGLRISYQVIQAWGRGHTFSGGLKSVSVIVDAAHQTNYC